VTHEGPHEIARKIRALIEDTGIALLAPMVRDEKGVHKHLLEWAGKSGYNEVRLNGIFASTEEVRAMRRDKEQRSTVEVVIGRYDQQAEAPQLEAQIAKAFDLADGFLVVARDDGEDDMTFSQRLTCSKDGIHLPELEPRIFSFNSPHGACQACTGLGTKLEVQPELVIPNPRLTLAQGAIKPWTRIAGNQQWYSKLLAARSARMTSSCTARARRRMR
jgi:excinuclease ABC subunit A